MDTAAWYRWFAENEARGSTAQYERLANAVADSDELLERLSLLPGAKRQPNLLFASVRFLGGPTDTVDGFVGFIRSNSDELEATMRARSTQTNEVARCAAFLPLLVDLDAELALIEVGASAGLCLFPDRYAYSYDGEQIGDSALEIAVETANTVPVPRRLPTVITRAGLDLNPLSVSDDEDLAWLRACIWPQHAERRQRLDLAATIVATDPPRIDQGDLRDATLNQIDQAPRDATKVVFHSAVLAYVDQASRLDFATTMRSLVNSRSDVVWLSNEGPSVIAGIEAADPILEPPGNAQFHLGRDGTELIAVTDPHGEWLRWMAPH
jgi:hypothetical protein